MVVSKALLGTISAPAITGSNPFVRLDLRLLLVSMLAGLLFLWPMLAYGRPGNLQDSAAYYKGGREAVAFALGKLHASPPATSSTAPVAGPASSVATPPVHDPHQVRGARSIAYSVAAYVLGAPRPKMWLLAAAQAFSTGFLCAVVLLLFGSGIRGSLTKLAVVAAATPVAFVVSLTVPDIFAGLVILAIALLAAFYRSLSPGVRIVSILIGAAGITFHASHLPIGLGVTALALALLLLAFRRGDPVLPWQWVSVLAPFVLGAALTVVLNSVAFGGASLAAKRFPLTLARSVSEGPGKWYLEKNCGHLDYAICEVYPNGVPGTVHTFLWGKTGVKERATPEQLDRIRAEEAEVVLAATRAYPFQEIQRLSINLGRQLISFQPGVGLDVRILAGPEGIATSEIVPFDPFWAEVTGALSIAAVLLSLALLTFRWRSAPGLQPLIVMVLFGILVNAAVCVYFSGITDRYQARVIWLIPLLALAALVPAGGRADAGQDESQR